MSEEKNEMVRMFSEAINGLTVENARRVCDFVIGAAAMARAQEQATEDGR